MQFVTENADNRGRQKEALTLNIPQESELGQKLAKALDDSNGRYDRFMARFILVVFVVAAVVILGCANIAATGEALQSLNPGLFGTKLSQLLTFMAGYAGWRKMTVGHVFAAAFFFFVAFAWKLVAKDLFVLKGIDLPAERFRLRNIIVVVRWVCGALWFADLILFYLGSTSLNSWTGKGHSYSGLLITFCYALISVIFAVGYLVLQHGVEQTRRR